MGRRYLKEDLGFGNSRTMSAVDDMQPPENWRASLYEARNEENPRAPVDAPRPRSKAREQTHQHAAYRQKRLEAIMARGLRGNS